MYRLKELKARREPVHIPFDTELPFCAVHLPQVRNLRDQRGAPNT